MAKDNVDSQFHKRFRNRIRFVRDLGRCQCKGECGYDHLSLSNGKSERCQNYYGKINPKTGRAIILKAVHMDYDIHNPKNENMMTMCFSCWHHYSLKHYFDAIQTKRWEKFLKSDSSKKAEKPRQLHRTKRG